MDVFVSSALVGVGLVLLCFGGNWLVGGGEMIAKRFRISSFVIGMTVVAYGTSTPELAASIAAAGEHSAIILGNIIGSNIANIGMVIGVSSILLPLVVEKDVLRKEVPIMIAVSVLLVIVSIDGEISSYDGLFLLGGLGVVTYRTLRTIKRQRSVDNTSSDKDVAHNRAEPKKDPASVMGDSSGDLRNGSVHDGVVDRVEQISRMRFYAKNFGMIGVGVAFLYAGAILTVDHAVILAKTFGLSEKVIGLTIVAIGTSLPELVTSIMAIRKGQGDIGVGNIIGSNIYNVLMIMGVGSALGGVMISSDVYVDYAIMLAFGGVLLIALKTKIINRFMGVCLASGYVAYLVLSLVR